MFWPKLSLCYIRKVFPTAASICATGCICTVRVFACKNVWRRGRWVLWLAGVMPAPADRRAELLASSSICPPITEQSARPDNTLSAAASHGSPCPLLPSHPLLPYPHCLYSSCSSSPAVSQVFFCPPARLLFPHHSPLSLLLLHRHVVPNFIPPPSSSSPLPSSCTPQNWTRTFNDAKFHLKQFQYFEPGNLYCDMWQSGFFCCILKNEKKRHLAFNSACLLTLCLY